MRTIPVFCVFFLLLLSVRAAGMHGFSGDGLNDTIRLDEVAVSVLPFKQSYMQSAGAVFTLNPSDLSQHLLVNTTALMNLVPGVYMASGTHSTNRLIIRGIGSRTPYNTNRIRAYLDDIPLTSGDGVSTLEDQDRLAIGRIEVLKGPASSLYGSGLGGVVRLQSPYPLEDGLSAGLSAEVGSFGTTLYGGTLSCKNEKVALNLGISHSSSEGYRDNSTYRRNNGFMNMKLFGQKNTLSLTLSMVDLFARIPSSLNEEDYVKEPWKAGGSWGEVKGYEEYFRMLGGLSLESRPDKNTLNKLVVFSTYADPYESRPFNILDDRSINLGFRELFQYELKSWKLNLGMEYFHEWVDWKIYDTNEGARGALMTHQDEIRKYMNAFAMVQWRPHEKVFIDGGLNLNLLYYGLETLFRQDSSDQSGHYRYKPVLSPRIGGSYNILESHYLYASVGHGFSAPSLEETLLPEGTVNTRLRPETGWNFDMGARGILLDGKIHYDATFYTIILNDLLVTERIAEDIFTGANAGKALNMGFELWGEYTVVKPTKAIPFELKAAISYTLSRNRFTNFVDEGINYSGFDLPGIPSSILNTILTTGWQPLEIKLHYHYSGRQWMDDLNSIEYAGHQLLHLQASWEFCKKEERFSLKLAGGIRNIFNASYSSMILVNAPSFGGSAPRYYYPGNPRQFHLGISLQFK